MRSASALSHVSKTAKMRRWPTRGLCKGRGVKVGLASTFCLRIYSGSEYWCTQLGFPPLRKPRKSGPACQPYNNKFLGHCLTTSRIVKYPHCVHIVTRKHLREAIKRHPDAANEIKAWVGIVERVRLHNFAEVRALFTDADSVDGYVIFNIGQNRYRLLTVIHYSKTTDEKQTEGHVYIRSFLTHKEYDNRGNWDRRFGTR